MQRNFIFAATILIMSLLSLLRRTFIRDLILFTLDSSACSESRINIIFFVGLLSIKVSVLFFTFAPLARLTTAPLLLFARISAVILISLPFNCWWFITLFRVRVVRTDALRVVSQIEKHLKQFIITVLMTKLSPMESFLYEFCMNIVHVKI